jgi:hypothetical protein
MMFGEGRRSVSYTHGPEHWRRRAEELRIIASAMTGMVRAKESILRTAEQYELKALQVEGRLRGLTATSP